MARSSAPFNQEDYSIYENLSDEELLQVAIERSLSDSSGCDSKPLTNANRANDVSAASNANAVVSGALAPSRRSSTRGAQAPTTAHYSSPNPPSSKPPDLKTFKGTISSFVTGSGKRMLAYRRPDGTLVHTAPEPEEEEEPLFKAIRLGYSNKVRALMMAPGTNLLMSSKPDWLATHQAAFYGQHACLSILLSAQPGIVNKRTGNGATALHIAIGKNQLRCVEALLENGADPNVVTHDKETPLFKACEQNNAAMVAVLLNHGAAVNARSLQGWTALQQAVITNNVEICEMLMSGGAKHNIANVYGISPLFTAAQTGQAAALRFLIRHGADLNSQAADGSTALYEAAKNGHKEIVEILLSQNADANISGKAGWLPLHVAAQTGNDPIVSLLIPVTSKARVRRTGISPLHVAAERNRDDVLETLIEAGFDVNAQLSEDRSTLYEDRRTTPLYFSVFNNNVEAVEMLLEAGANPNLDMFRPLMVAARHYCTQIITMLVEHGADVNAAIPTHPTTFPAVFMFSMKYLQLFKYLLDHGAHALSCFDCVYGRLAHLPIKTTRAERDTPTQLGGGVGGVQFCEMISAPSICRWAGPIIDVLLDYVGHVTLCSRLVEHLDSFYEWSAIKEKAAWPRPLMHLCRLHILQLLGGRSVETLPLPPRLVRFLQHQERVLDD